MKEYYNQNKDKIIEKAKEYRENNKEKIAEHEKQKVDCECGGKYTHVHKSRHFKSIKHCQFIESQNTKIEVYEV